MIDFNNVHLAFGTQVILNDVSFRIGTGERVGIVGTNGAGKSTIFSLIMGDLNPESGSVQVQRGIKIGYLKQQLRAYAVESTLLEYAENAVPELNDIHHEIMEIEHTMHNADPETKQRMLKRLGILQTQYEEKGGYELNSRASAILCGLGFTVADLEKPFKSFSGGWQMRAELARALVSIPDILLLDEATNFLDIPAVEWLQRYLSDFAGTLVLISHDRYLLNTLTDITFEVMLGKVTRYSGNYNSYIQQRQIRHDQLLAARRNQDRNREQIERFIERFRAKNTKATQVQSRIKQLEKIDIIEIPPEMMRPAKFRLPAPFHCGQEVIRLENAGLTYDQANWVLRNVELRIERGEKTALVGLNGMGKTTLLRMLAGKLELNEGKRVVGHKTVIGYQAQDFAENMDPNVTVYETARSVAPRLSDNQIRTILGGFFFPGDTVEKTVDVLSGGEKMRLALARLLLSAPNFLLMDEPTTHLDIASREALEEALYNYEGTLILVSHDIEFVRRVAKTVIAMVPGNIQRYAGDYEYYKDKIASETAATAEPAPRRMAPVNNRKAQRQESAIQRQQLYQITKDVKKRIASLEGKISKLETEQHELEKMMAATSPAVDPNYAEYGRRIKTIMCEIGRLTNDWEIASLELEEILSKN